MYIFIALIFWYSPPGEPNLKTLNLSTRVF